jgi:hypothetical protein
VSALTRDEILEAIQEYKSGKHSPTENEMVLATAAEQLLNGPLGSWQVVAENQEKVLQEIKTQVDNLCKIAGLDPAKDLRNSLFLLRKRIDKLREMQRALYSVAEYFNVHRTWEREPNVNPTEVALWIKQSMTSTLRKWWHLGRVASRLVNVGDLQRALRGLDIPDNDDPDGVFK